MKKRKKKNKTQPKKSKNLLHTHMSLEPKKQKTMKKNYKYPIKIRIKNQKEHKRVSTIQEEPADPIIPLGPKVTETASASLSIPACNDFLQFVSKEIFLGPALMVKILPSCRFLLEDFKTLFAPLRC